jgi:flavin-dependent dehydrogenase
MHLALPAARLAAGTLLDAFAKDSLGAEAMGEYDRCVGRALGWEQQGGRAAVWALARAPRLLDRLVAQLRADPSQRRLATLAAVVTGRRSKLLLLPLLMGWLC